MKKETQNKTKKRVFTGEVMGTGMDKTINVKVVTRKLHPKYKKYYHSNKKYHVHDDKGLAKVGDTVRFIECRPLSKTKRWRLIEVVNK